ncbi:hypothetical protein C240_1221 [Enterococcus sp. 5H]|nr:hypothetical protein [Enterococcus sp. 5H]
MIFSLKNKEEKKKVLFIVPKAAKFLYFLNSSFYNFFQSILAFDRQ